jgi:hypothetical protein
LKLNAPQLGGIEKIDRLYLKSFLYRVALVGAGVCPGVSNSVARRGTNSCVISRFATLLYQQLCDVGRVGLTCFSWGRRKTHDYV